MTHGQVVVASQLYASNHRTVAADWLMAMDLLFVKHDSWRLALDGPNWCSQHHDNSHTKGLATETTHQCNSYNFLLLGYASLMHTVHALIT